MAEPTLTPGEWKPENWDGFTMEWLRSPEGKPDRDMIAAAKDMYYALKGIKAAFDRIPEGEQIPDSINTPSREWDDVVAAIAKARGETS